jgi:hypothetical protein
VTVTAGSAPGANRTSRWPSASALLELLGVTGVVIAQPVLSVFGAAPDYFVFEGADRNEILAFGLAVAFGPPLVMWLVVSLLGAGSDHRRRTAQAAAVGLVVALLGLQLANQRTLALGLAVGGVLGIAAAVAHWRWPLVRLWLRWLAPVPLVVLLVFTFSSPVSGLVTGGDVDPAELGPFASGDPPPIVMVVFDEWPLASIMRRDGTLDAELYPNLARLAAGATWYRDTTTVANLTNFAVPALLTGNRPEEGQTADAATHPQNLFTLLGGTYRLDVTERITRLCPRSLCRGDTGTAGRAGATTLGKMLQEAGSVFADRVTPGERSEPVTDVFVEPEAAVDAARSADDQARLDDLLDPRPASLDRFLDGFAAGEEPTLHFLHLLEPHTPHAHLPDGHQYGADPALRQISVRVDGEPGGDRRGPETAPALLDRQRLQLEVAHIDRLVGDLLDRLHETGLYDDALVVVTSDHGLAFRPGGTVRGLGIEPIEATAQPELLWVPLLVKAPGQTTGGVRDVPAETIDVVPTIADLLGIDLPWTVDGTALADVAGDRDRTFSHVQGSSFATFQLDPPVALAATLSDVERLGTDSVLLGGGPDRWWRAGPRPSAVGRIPTGPVVDAEIDRRDVYLDVDLDDPVVPALVSGRVAGDLTRVAIVLNGTTAAVVDTFTDAGGPGRFAAMVDPGRLVEGVNDLAVHQA